MATQREATHLDGNASALRHLFVLLNVTWETIKSDDVISTSVCFNVGEFTRKLSTTNDFQIVTSLYTDHSVIPYLLWQTLLNCASSHVYRQSITEELMNMKVTGYLNKIITYFFVWMLMTFYSLWERFARSQKKVRKNNNGKLVMFKMSNIATRCDLFGEFILRNRLTLKNINNSWNKEGL